MYQFKMNPLLKVFLKIANRSRYISLKEEIKAKNENMIHQEFEGRGRLTTPLRIQEAVRDKEYVVVKHSGNAGDIVYSLPVAKEISKLTNKKVIYSLNPDVPIRLDFPDSHPLGGVMLNGTMIDMLSPLLYAQDYIESVCEFDGGLVDIDFDFFRSLKIPCNNNIARWCSYITAVAPKLYEPWLSVTPDERYRGAIIVARSSRYRNRSISYSSLNYLEEVWFIGVESEYRDMLQVVPKLKWLKVVNFLEMARAIAACRFFFGNQSFPYSVAEALKVPRALEGAYSVKNVIPEGVGSNEYLFQHHFNYLVSELR